MLRPRNHMPHITVTGRDGETFRYERIWQRQILLLVLVDGADQAGADRYVERLDERMADLTAHETTCLVTPDHVPDAPSPGVVIADRWGEIWHVYRAASNAELPPPAELVEWLRYVQMQCPECEGEVR